MCSVFGMASIPLYASFLKLYYLFVDFDFFPYKFYHKFINILKKFKLNLHFDNSKFLDNWGMDCCPILEHRISLHLLDLPL